MLAVLWLSAALAAIAFSVAATVRGETERAATASDRVRTYYLAEGSIDRGLLWILWGAGPRNPDGSPRFYDPPMPILRMRYPSGEAIVEVMPETSKLDVNAASPDDLLRLVIAVGADPDRARGIVTGILDWRAGTPGLGLFDQYYASRNPSFRARHASMEEIEELLLVRGMTPELFYGSYTRDENGHLIARGGLRDCLSVYGATGQFDVNTAAPALLLSLGIPAESVAAMVAARRVRPFHGAGEAAAFGAGPAIGRLRVGGNSMWTLRASARLRQPDGKLSDLTRTVAAIVKFLPSDRWDPPYHIVRWYDDAWSQSAVIPMDPPAAAPNRNESLQ